MFHRWAALVLVLALCAFAPKYAAGQATTPRGHGAGSIGRNYPNPFNPDTYVTFTVGDTATCDGVSEHHVVTMRILNILAQPVVFPVLFGPAPNTTRWSVPSSHPRLEGLTLSCGAYQAYWDGTIQSSGREAASGTYLVQLFVDNHLSGTSKIFYSK